MQKVDVSDSELLREYKLRVAELEHELILYKAALNQTLREKNGGKDNARQVGKTNTGK